MRPRPRALPPTQEAVDTYRALAADNPAFLPDLAGALNNIGNRHNELGEPDRGDAIWQEVSVDFSDDSRAILLLFRASAAQMPDLRAAAWLTEASRSPDRALVAEAHRLARRHRLVDPGGWDAAWTAATDEAPRDMTESQDSPISGPVAR